MATTALGGTPATTVGDLPTVGSAAPSWTLVDTDLAEITSSSLEGRRVVLNIFPSVGTGVCAQSVRTFNERAAGLDNTSVVCVSQDLPFALAAFCGAEGLDDVVPLSAFRSTFGTDFGVLLTDSKFEGLLARAVVVLDESGTVTHTQLVDDIATEPDYDAALAALS